MHVDCTLTIKVWGGAGGGANGEGCGSQGGAGGFAQGSFEVSKGEQYMVLVGGGGGGAPSYSSKDVPGGEPGGT